ncbi:MAG: protein kinase domain-containing protein [Alphaproteobacteria bacterium]
MKQCNICERTYGDDARVCELDGTILTDFGPRQDPLVGKTINSRYRVLQKLGEGGMSAVYLAEQINIERKVALKVLHGEYARDELFVRRFRQEAKLAASLNHRNVIQVYDFDQAEDGNLFIAMEYVLGKTLKGFVRAGAPDIATVVHLAIQIADGLAAAHRAGVIHRDIKPENIMIARQGNEVKIMDFGIARLREADAATRLTRAGSIMGTPAYMAPEQIEGKQISEKTDIYAFGIVLYEMLSNNVPFTAPTPAAVLIKHLKEAPVPLRKLRREIPAQLERIVTQALEKRPERRPAKMEDVTAALRKAELEFPAASAKPLSSPQTLESGEGKKARQPSVARTELQATVALNEGIASIDALSKPGPQQHISEYRQTPDEARARVEQSMIASTVALTQPVEAISIKRTHWKWLLIGGGALPVAILAVWAAITFYGQSSNENMNKPPPVAGVEHTPARAITSAVIRADTQEVPLNAQTALRLNARYSDGTSEEIKENVEWTSSDPSVLSFATAGMAEAKAVGTVQVSARYQGVSAPPLDIRVVQPKSQEPVSAPRLVSLAIQAARSDLYVNGRLALRVRGKYSDGKEGEVKTVRWESSDRTIAVVNAEGEVSGQRKGTVQVIARTGDVASEPVTLTIKAIAPKQEPQRTKETQPGNSIVKKQEPNPAKDEQKAKGAQSKERVKMARLYRERGDYAHAFAELEKARKIDPRNTEVQGEIAITKRACMAERTLGRTDLNC